MDYPRTLRLVEAQQPEPLAGDLADLFEPVLYTLLPKARVLYRCRRCQTSIVQDSAGSGTTALLDHAEAHQLKDAHDARP